MQKFAPYKNFMLYGILKIMGNIENGSIDDVNEKGIYWPHLLTTFSKTMGHGLCMLELNVGNGRQVIKCMSKIGTATALSV